MGMNNKFVLILKKDKEYDIKQIESNLIKAFKKLEITDKVNLNIVYIENIDYNYIKDINQRDKLVNSFKENVVENLKFNLENDKESIYNLITIDYDIKYLITDSTYNVFEDERIKHVYYIDYNKCEFNPVDEYVIYLFKKLSDLFIYTHFNHLISNNYPGIYPGKYKRVKILNNEIIISEQEKSIKIQMEKCNNNIEKSLEELKIPADKLKFIPIKEINNEIDLLSDITIHTSSRREPAVYL